MQAIRKMKIELLSSVLSVIVAFICLLSTTYAWYVMNNRVEATTTTVSATTNGFILQIATVEEGAQHGGEQKSLVASTEGYKITPSSTKDLKDWYINLGMNGEGKVNAYQKVNFKTGDDVKVGEYEAGGETHYAYLKSEYILYTITETGKADVYLDSSEGEPITVFVDNGKTPTSDTIPDSMRIAITTQPLDIDGKTPTGTETLRIVYAPKEVSGKGNDSQAIEGKWTYIGNDGGTLKPIAVTNEYQYIYADHYIDQDGKNWAATKSGDDYTVPADSESIAREVGYNGIMMHVYIWMEGTDADCVNNDVAEDEATYSVTVKLAGVAS